MIKLDDNLLANYAQVMVRYALNNGDGIRRGDTVFLAGTNAAKTCSWPLPEKIYAAGGNLHYPLSARQYPQGNSLPRFLLENGSDEQVTFFAKPYWQGIVEAADHILFIIAEPDIHAFEGLPAAKISRMNSARAPYMKMREEKEQAGKLSWSLCLYGTQSMADEAGLSLEEYWEQIIEACYLREDDPVAKWKAVQKEIESIKDKLDALHIDTPAHQRRRGGPAHSDRRASQMAERRRQKHSFFRNLYLARLARHTRVYLL